MGEIDRALEDLNSTNKDILDAINELDNTMIEVLGGIEQVDITLGGILEQGGGGGGGGAAGGASQGGRKGGGGRPGAPSKPGGKGGGAGPLGLLALARAHPMVAAFSAAAGFAAPTVGAGAISASRGGDFQAGFESNLNKRIGQIPFFGEASGFAGAARIEQKTTADVAQVVASIEGLGGKVSDEDVQTLIRQQGTRQERIESANEKVRALSQKTFRGEPELLGESRGRVSAEQAQTAIGGGFGIFGLLNALTNESSGLGTFK